MNHQRRMRAQRERRFVPRASVYWLVVGALTQLLACESAYPNVDSTSSSSAAARADWCAVQRVLAGKCQRCHGAPPAHGAPFSLVSYDDTQVANRQGEVRYLTLQKAITDDAMPPLYLKLEPPPEPLADDEKQLLLDWCSAGAPPPGDQPCPEP